MFYYQVDPAEAYRIMGYCPQFRFVYYLSALCMSATPASNPFSSLNHSSSSSVSSFPSNRSQSLMQRPVGRCHCSRASSRVRSRVWTGTHIATVTLLLQFQSPSTIVNADFDTRQVQPGLDNTCRDMMAAMSLSRYAQVGGARVKCRSFAVVGLGCKRIDFAVHGARCRLSHFQCV